MAQPARFCLVFGFAVRTRGGAQPYFFFAAPSTGRPLARDPRVLIGWPFPLGFGLDGRLLLARRGRVYVEFIITTYFYLAFCRQVAVAY